MTAIRQDVAALGQGWNKTLLNYALAVRELDGLPLADRNSWKFLGAVHGFDRTLWIAEGLIAQGDAIPPDLVDGSFGNQCQHGSWYFLSWHRGYLAAFEAIVAAKVKELTGDDWALPYWNYLDAGNAHARDVPEAFLAAKLPDGSDNPLSKYPRRPGLRRLEPGSRDAFDLRAGSENDFIVGNDGSIGFGGGITGDFLQFARWTGDLESNPHNTVHRLLGGDEGYMADPRLAGLDPLFWLHHCNIDRMWEAWMATPGKSMVKDPRWSDGPADRKFVMPAVGGSAEGVRFTSRETLRGGRLHPQYDDLRKGTGLSPAAATVARVGMGPAERQKVSVVGANGAVVQLSDAPVTTSVRLDGAAAAAGVASMAATAQGAEVSRFYLALESVRGTAPSPLVEVYVNLPTGVAPETRPDRFAGSVTMFGLNVASQPDGGHGGNGLSYTLDITELAQRLEAAGEFAPDRLNVTLVPSEQISDARPITVDRISILRRTGNVS